MEDSLNNRIRYLINTLEDGSQTKFASKVGIKVPTINTIVGTRQSIPRADMLQKITQAYGNVSSEWLLSGKGTPFIDNCIENHASVNRSTEKDTEEVINLREMVAELRKDKALLSTALDQIMKMNQQLGKPTGNLSTRPGRQAA